MNHMNGLVHVDLHEYERLKAVEDAWSKVFFALKKGNPMTFHGPGTGIECAVREIERLQAAEARARTLEGLALSGRWVSRLDINDSEEPTT